MASSEREWRISEREYDSLTDEQIDDILDDTGRDDPHGKYTAAEVYAIARDLKEARRLFRDLLKAKMIHNAGKLLVQEFLAGSQPMEDME